MDSTLPHLKDSTGIVIGPLMDPRLPLGSAADFVSGQRILSPFEAILPDLTKRDEPIFTGLAAVKVFFVRLCLATKCRHLSVS